MLWQTLNFWPLFRIRLKNNKCADYFRKRLFKSSVCATEGEVLASCDWVRKYKRPLCGASRLLGLLQATEDAVNVMLVSRYISRLQVRSSNNQSFRWTIWHQSSVSEHTCVLNTFLFHYVTHYPVNLLKVSSHSSLCE